jgi:hypothetical protein
MIIQIASYQILGIPLVGYTGMVTLLSFLFTASISMMNKRGVTFVPFQWHPRMAAVSITLGLIHGLLGLAFLLGF